MIQSPFLVLYWRTAQEELRRKPPVGDVDSLGRFLQGLRNRPHVILRIDIPLDAIAFVDRGERLEAVRLGALGALVVGGLLMLFIMAMIGIDNVEELADLVLEVSGFGFHIVDMGFYNQD